jgi:Tripartite tricarboxylate transporter TctB family
VGFTVLALALIQVLVALRTALKEGRPAGQNRSHAVSGGASAGGNQSVSENSLRTADPRRRLLTICSWVVGFLLGIWLLGFKLGSLCLTFLFLKFTAREKWIISIAIAVGTYLFFWLVFDIALKVPLDKGLISDLVETSF